METRLLQEQIAVRRRLVDFLVSDLVGPKEESEKLTEAPLTRYIAGILYPSIEGDGNAQIVDQEAQEDTPDDDGEISTDPAVAMSNVQYPSSAGITFAVADDVEVLRATASVARYEAVGDEDEWQRVPIGPLDQTLDLAISEERYPLADGLELYCRSRSVHEGARSITVALVNTQIAEPGRKDAHSFFQAALTLSPADENEAPFVARPSRLDVGDEDLETNALLYRNSPEFAIGHGCAADWDRASDPSRATAVYARFVPEHEVPLMESNREIPDNDLRFDFLATARKTEVVPALKSFLAGYSAWIAERETEAASLDSKQHATARKHLADCSQARDRVLAGIETLASNEMAFRAFQLANRAMADQMGATARVSGGSTDRAEFKWRPFQLAFVLLALRSLAELDSEERDIADLLWFPTGGGKTEAYLGLFAFATFYRRLAKDGAAGVVAIMRYTLRLLTTQQFERAARVVCACEAIRRAEADLGAEPISIGLFVGRGSTPNSVEDAKAALNKLRAGQDLASENPCQLTSCSWCGNPLGPLNYTIREAPHRLQIECRNSGCEFAEGLPVYVVDEDLYRVRPTLVIGTIDKFAGFPWRPALGRLLNLGPEGDPPPELVIQDELHLISGPLGTLAGLYEGIIDLVSDRRGAKPKVIASTATIRRAAAQTTGLFAREMKQFPPPGIDPGDSWFARTAPPDRVGARKYVGLMAPGVSHATLLIRAYAAVMHAASLEDKGPALDPYWTLIGYFNSLRVLGAARMQVQDDVHDWINLLTQGAGGRELSEPIELTSRADSADIPKYLERMEVEVPDPDALDVVLATNMISVGMDVDRLGLMAIMGQPQAAAEYIQASSRVGRKHPGLVLMLFNAARSRDRSHYEAFRGFHEALYRSVEATSVTPFSPRARDRALHAFLVGLARLTVLGLEGNDDAVQAPAYESELRELASLIETRAREVDESQAAETRQDLENFIDRWVLLAGRNPELLYESWNGTKPALLKAASPEEDNTDETSTMWSLRDVDAESELFPVSVT
jgi:hypothetical protein